MTPQERQLIAELFDRLATLEGRPRDAEAETAISEGSRRAPNALYALVQTVLVQDEALRRADEHIRALEGEPQPPGGGSFLDTMRDGLFGRREEPRGSVPSVRADGAGFRNAPGYRSMEQQPPQYQQPPYQPQPGPQAGFGGGSFLGTAAASAAGAIGGAMLFNSMRSLMGGGNGQQHGAFDSRAGGGDKSPWGGDAAGSDLSRQAGADDIGRGGGRLASNDDGDRRAGLFDTAQNDAEYDSGYDDSGDVGGSDDA